MEGTDGGKREEGGNSRWAGREIMKLEQQAFRRLCSGHPALRLSHPEMPIHPPSQRQAAYATALLPAGTAA